MLRGGNIRTAKTSRASCDSPGFEIDPAGRVEVPLVEGGNRAGLAVARSLARRGISFALISEDLQGVASCSRIGATRCARSFPLANGEAFVRFLLEFIGRYGIRLAIPVTDQALLLFQLPFSPGG